MEACAGAHHWARELQSRGFTVRLIPPQFVKPHVKSDKNDANDAEAICEAMSRPNMRFVTVKSGLTWVPRTLLAYSTSIGGSG
jgi:transposase